MKREVCALAIALIVFLPPSAGAEQIDTYQTLKETPPSFAHTEKKIMTDSSYEYSFVRIGPKKVVWQLLTNQIMYSIKGQIPYLEINWHERDRVSDVTLNGGSYFRFKNSNLHIEHGFGFDTDYIYRYQFRAEYEHRLVKTLFYKASERYLHYRHSEVGVFSPVGATIYYGNHYITADYDFSITEGRGDAHWGSIKLNLELFDGMNAWTGAAFGQRLYDIQTIKAAKQGGIILFVGGDYRISDNIKFRTGYSYGQEKPNYLNRSIDVGLNIKF